MTDNHVMKQVDDFIAVAPIKLRSSQLTQTVCLKDQRKIEHPGGKASCGWYSPGAISEF